MVSTCFPIISKIATRVTTLLLSNLKLNEVDEGLGYSSIFGFSAVSTFTAFCEPVTVVIVHCWLLLLLLQCCFFTERQNVITDP